MNIKIFFSITAIIIGLFGFIPYLKDILSKKTKPHIYTWLIWTITTGTATFGAWYGKGGWGIFNLTIMTLFVSIIFLLSFKYGTKNITKIDTIILIATILAIIVWWQLKNPLISIAMISAIDFTGYIPSFRKSYWDPWSETISLWLIASLSNFFVILALNEYSFLTLFYLATITSANLILFSICFVRRFSVKRLI